MIFGERSSDRPETALVYSGDPPDSIGTTFPRIWPNPDFGEFQGRREFRRDVITFQCGRRHRRRRRDVIAVLIACCDVTAN